jgi:hypothetical protein
MEVRSTVGLVGWLVACSVLIYVSFSMELVICGNKL